MKVLMNKLKLLIFFSVVLCGFANAQADPSNNMGVSVSVGGIHIDVGKNNGDGVTVQMPRIGVNIDSSDDESVDSVDDENDEDIDEFEDINEVEINVD